MAAGGDHDGDDWPAVHRHPANRRQQRRAQLAESDRFGRLDNPTVDLWFNPADFVAPPPNTYGDSGRGILYGPGHTNFDTSLSKRFSVGGRANAEFRWDVFNLFNHPGFGFPNAAVGNPTVGRITTTIVDNRSMQLAVKVNF